VLVRSTAFISSELHPATNQQFIKAFQLPKKSRENALLHNEKKRNYACTAEHCYNITRCCAPLSRSAKPFHRFPNAVRAAIEHRKGAPVHRTNALARNGAHDRFVPQHSVQVARRVPGSASNNWQLGRSALCPSINDSLIQTLRFIQKPALLLHPQ
jgi:hypothetical protein